MSEAITPYTPSTPTAPTDEEIDRIRARGQLAVARKKELNRLTRQLEGMEWGTAKGSDLSPHTRYALAEFCEVTGANPQVHIDVLGGRPYLNASYWSDKINSDPYFIRYEQREISESTEQALRARAAELRGLGDPEHTARAIDLEMEADDIARARSHWRPPEWATHVYETTVYRYQNAAPIEKIQAGEEDPERWVVTVTECNWAGGKNQGKADPVGNAEPSKTARTRSLRRAASRAFAAWMQRYDQQIRRAEELIEAEFVEILSSSNGNGSGEQAVLASGEPSPGDGEGARELPGTVAAAEPAEPDASSDGADEVAQILEDRRKKYFATLRAAGIESGDRKAWESENGFSGSVSDWTLPDFNRALVLLIGPWREKYITACEVMGQDPEDFALQELGQVAEYLEHYRELYAKLNRMADAGAAGGAA